MRMDPKLKQIADLDLSSFEKPVIAGNRSFLWRATWYLVNAIFFQGSIGGLIPNGSKTAILRFFGARIGDRFVCKPGVRIKYPWFLEIGHDVWIGEGAWIDNLCSVKIGNNTCLSQGVCILTGSHDWNDRKFRFFALPVSIADGVWVTAFRVVRPGASIPKNVVVLGDVGRRPTGPAEEVSG